MDNEKSPEELELLLDSEARLIMKDLLDLMRSDPNPTPESYHEEIGECMDKLQKMADMRSLVDRDIWLIFQITLAYDHFATAIDEFDEDFKESLHQLKYLTGYLPSDDLLTTWSEKIKSTFG